MFNYERLLEMMEEVRIEEINAEHRWKKEHPVAIDHNECWYLLKINFKYWINAKDIESSNRAILDYLPEYENKRYSVREGRSYPRNFSIVKLLGKYITLNNYRASA